MHPPVRGPLIEVLADVGPVVAVTITLLQGPSTLQLVAVAFRDFFRMSHATKVSLSMKGPNGAVHFGDISEEEELGEIVGKLRDILK